MMCNFKISFYMATWILFVFYYVSFLLHKPCQTHFLSHICLPNTSEERIFKRLKMSIYFDILLHNSLNRWQTENEPSYLKPDVSLICSLWTKPPILKLKPLLMFNLQALSHYSSFSTLSLHACHTMTSCENLLDCPLQLLAVVQAVFCSLTQDFSFIPSLQGHI